MACALLVATGAAAADAAAGDPATEGIAAQAIDLYQTYLSSLRHGHCRFAPSCSDYAREAIRAYGPIEGTARAADRLMRCNAASGRYHDRLPDGRLSDSVGAQGPLRRVRMPEWILPPRSETPPPLGLAGVEAPARVAEIVGFADALVREGDCSQAATEYHRAAHVLGSPDAHAWSGARSGGCYFREGDWVQAERCFLEAAMLSPDSDSRARDLLLAAGCRFNMGDFAGAGRLAEATLDSAGSRQPSAMTGASGAGVATLNPVAFHGPGPATGEAPALGASGLALMARGQWSAASGRFRQAAAVSSEREQVERFRLLAARAPAGARLPQRSPGAAVALSAVVPGAGQIYSGRTREGLRHLLVDGVLIYSIVQLISDEKYPAAVLVTGITLPFYLGNLHGAQNAARDFNRSQRLDFVSAAVEEASR